MVLRRQRIFVAGVALIVACGGSIIFGGCTLVAEKYGLPAFNHAAHSSKRISCDACHESVASSEVAAMPTFGTCKVCHASDQEREFYPYETMIAAKEPEQLLPARERYADLKFSHELHIQKGFACEECHGDVGTSDAVTSRHRTRQSFCESCHDRNGLRSDCEICHVTLNETIEPQSHQGIAWMKLHGRDAEHGTELGHEENCQLCHTKSECINCHSIERPDDHSEFFRQRGHGFASEIDRQRCMVCHQESFCIRCHQQESPRNHRSAVWAGGTSNHCLSCHEPLSDSSCSVCHKSTSSHLMATPIPPPPHPDERSNCYQCHLRPPHADNGMPCIVCHHR